MHLAENSSSPPALGSSEFAQRPAAGPAAEPALAQARRHRHSSSAPKIRISEGCSQKLVMVLLHSLPAVGRDGRHITPILRIRPMVGCHGRILRSTLLVVVLANHDARMAEPLRNNDDHRAPHEPEHRPRNPASARCSYGRAPCPQRAGMASRSTTNAQHHVTPNHHRFEAVAQELDELGEFHYSTAWTKLKKNPG